MRVAWMLAAIAVALTLQTTLARFSMDGAAALDLVLVVVVGVALASGPGMGLAAGTIGGLAQDALSGGIIGVGGLAKTLVGFGAGAVGSQFIIAQPLPRFVVFFAATVVHAACFLGLYALLEPGGLAAPYSRVAGQALANGVVGVLMLHALESLPGSVQRRRAGRPHLGRRRF